MWWLILIAVTVLVLAAWAVSRVLRGRTPQDLDRLRANQSAAAEARERLRRDRNWGDDSPGNPPHIHGL